MKVLLRVRTLLCEIGVDAKMPMKMLVDNKHPSTRRKVKAALNSFKLVGVKLTFVRDTSAERFVLTEFCVQTRCI